MKTILLSSLLTISILVKAQINPTLIIDNQPVKFQGNTSLPYWISAGKTIALGQDAVSISILEFTLNNSNLEFNQAIHLTSSSLVPTGKVWKIEGIGIGNNSTYNSISSFSNSIFKLSIAILDAISPALCPPIPSATASKYSSLSLFKTITLSSL